MSEGKRGRGRPSAYKERVEPRLAEIGEWAQAGATNREIAEALGVGYSNFEKYVSENKELRELLKGSRLSGVPEVRLALYRRAVGFEYEEKVISVRKDEDGEMKQFIETRKKRALPDVGAIQTYLRNYSDGFRDRDKTTYDFKRLELELRKTSMENEDFR